MNQEQKVSAPSINVRDLQASIEITHSLEIYTYSSIYNRKAVLITITWSAYQIKSLQPQPIFYCKLFLLGFNVYVREAKFDLIPS